MNVYVESNFVLELALLQEQWKNCCSVLKHCAAGRAHLVIPGYCLAEPYGALVGRQKRRRKVREDVEAELKQIARSEIYKERFEGFRELTSFLIKSAEDEDNRLLIECKGLLQSAEVIPLDASVLAASTEYRQRHGFSPQDAIVYASVLLHLQTTGAPESCFLNRDKDFGDEEVVEELRSYGCELLRDFEAGYQFIVDSIG